MRLLVDKPWRAPFGARILSLARGGGPARVVVRRGTYRWRQSCLVFLEYVGGRYDNAAWVRGQPGTRPPVRSSRQ